MHSNTFTLKSDTRFAALASHTAGEQALAILERIGRNVELLIGPMPFIPTKSVIFVQMDGLDIPNRYLRILPVTPKQDRSTDLYLERIASEMGFLRSDRDNRIVFISMQRADRSTGRFEGKHEKSFTDALYGLCGYRPPAPERPKRDWKAERELRRRSRVEDEFGKPLWALPD